MALYRLRGYKEAEEMIHFLEDWWRELGGEEKALLGLVVLAMALMIVTLRFGP